MDVSQLIQQKLNELGIEQRDLADAAEVTESYISQLLSREKVPPAPEHLEAPGCREGVGQGRTGT